MPASCYLCGSTNDLTKDHIPPRCFFPPDARTNLITVDCCRSCNEEYSADDEVMVRWFTSSAFASHQGKWVFDNKVAKTLQRSAKLATRLMESMRELTLDTSVGKVAGYSLSIPTEQFHRFIVRICKGLLKEFFPQFDYSKTTFLTESMLPTVESNQMLAETLSQLQCVSRGGTVFRFWHGHVIDHPDKGLFVLMFYEGAVALTFYGTDLKLPFVP